MDIIYPMLMLGVDLRLRQRKDIKQGVVFMQGIKVKNVI